MIFKETTFENPRTQKAEPIFSLYRNEQDANKQGSYPYISFGLAKAKAILANMEALKAFVTKHESSGEAK